MGHNHVWEMIQREQIYRCIYCPAIKNDRGEISNPTSPKTKRKQLLICYANGAKETRRLPDDAEVIARSDGKPMWIAWGENRGLGHDPKDKIYLGNGLAFWEMQEVDDD